MNKTIFVCALALSARAVWACDICATPVALGSWEAAERASISVFEQYSKYDRPASGGHEFESYTTQVGVRYCFSDHWAFQLSVPYMDRELDGETESGLGDVSMLGVFRAVHRVSDHGVGLLDIYAGVEAPTGDTDPLKDERDVARENAEEHHHDGEAAEPEEPHMAHSHGHHVSPGSGSWDGIIGLRALARHNRWQGSGEAQYIARTEGDYDFQYGDEFIVRAGIRYYLVLEDNFSVALGGDISREWGDENEVLGQVLEEADPASSYVGPAVDLTWRDRLTLSAGWDVAIEGENEGLHGAADKRARASVAYQF